MNILFYGGHYWDHGSWFRKQQYASRLAKRGHRVFYIEDSVSMVRKNDSHKNELFKTKVQKINDNLFIITPSAIFPFPRNPYSRKLYSLKLFSDIKRILKNNDAEDFIFWMNRIEFSTNLKKIKSTKILDLCDDLPFYAKLAGDESGYNTLMNYLSTAVSQSDIPIVSAAKIKEKYQYLTQKEILVVPNGHNINLNGKHELPVPDDLKDMQKPVIGFLGTLFRFTDDELLQKIISERPNYNFVFVGDVESHFPIDKIKNFKNVFLLGKKKKEEVPNYINAFDICINPFKIHEVNDSVNPVKVFEYLAFRKPIVSTYMYSLMKENIANYITFGKDYDEFLHKIDCIVKDDNYTNQVPDEAIEEYHWDNLFLSMLKKIKEVHGLEL